MLLALDQSSRITGYAIFNGDKLVHYGKFVLIKRDGSRLQPYCERTEDASSIEDIGENLGYLSLEENPIEFMTAMRNGFAAFGYTLDT